MRAILTTTAHGIGWLVLGAILLSVGVASVLAMAVFVAAGVNGFIPTLYNALGMLP